jgi:hypothetical protein
METLNIAVRCKNDYESNLVQAIAEGSTKLITPSFIRFWNDVVFTRGNGQVYNWTYIKPTIPIQTFDEFISEFGYRIHEIEGIWDYL